MSDERLEKTQHDAPPASPATAPALETLEDAQRFLQEARHFADELERWEAIQQVCAQFDSEALMEYLLPFLNDPDPLVRVNAIDALEGIPQFKTPPPRPATVRMQAAAHSRRRLLAAKQAARRGGWREPNPLSKACFTDPYQRTITPARVNSTKWASDSPSKISGS